MTTQHEVEVPRAPANLTARPTSAFSILVTWDAPAGSVSGSGADKNKITKYKLYHRRVSVELLFNLFQFLRERRRTLLYYFLPTFPIIASPQLAPAPSNLN